MSDLKKTKVTADSGKQDIFITREFDAPPALVFRAHQDPEIFVQWHGCGGVRMEAKQFAAKTGGEYHFVQNVGGQDFKQFGSYHMVRPDKIVRTSEFSGYPDRCMLEITTFEALPGNRTRLLCQMVFQSVEDRDAMVRVGVDEGANHSHVMLDELLQKML